MHIADPLEMVGLRLVAVVLGIDIAGKVGKGMLVLQGVVQDTGPLAAQSIAERGSKGLVRMTLPH